MSVESVAQVEQDLGLTPEDSDTLKGVRLVWQKIQKLRGQAVRDDKYLSQFKDILSRSLVQARAQQAPESEDDIVARTQEFWQWYEDYTKTLGVAAKERDRGSSHQDWCAKWLVREWNAFYLAYDRIVNQPSALHFEQAKDKAKAMLGAYMGAFSEKHS